MTSNQGSGEVRPGEIVWANVVNGCERRGTTGKERPVVVVEVPKDGGCLRVVGLTSRSRTVHGAARRSLRCSNLPRRSYIFSERLTSVARHDVYERIGRIEPSEARVISEQFDLPSDWSER